MKYLLAVIVAITMLVSLPAGADEAAVRSLFQRQFPGSAVKSISKTPVPGIVEVVIDGRILYATEDGRYVFAGALIDTRTNRNLTKARLEKINSIPFDSLPLDLAIKRVKGDGSRKIAIFEDPDCPYCKKLEREIVGIDNLTIYTLLFPIEQIHPGATNKSRAIWCAKDRSKAWDDAMLFDVVPDKSVSCKTPIARIVDFGHEHGINGTPTIIFADGRRVVGALSTEDIKKELASSEKH